MKPCAFFVDKLQISWNATTKTNAFYTTDRYPTVAKSLSDVAF